MIRTTLCRSEPGVIWGMYCDMGMGNGKWEP